MSDDHMCALCVLCVLVRVVCVCANCNLERIVGTDPNFELKEAAFVWRVLYGAASGEPIDPTQPHTHPQVEYMSIQLWACWLCGSVVSSSAIIQGKHAHSPKRTYRAHRALSSRRHAYLRSRDDGQPVEHVTVGRHVYLHERRVAPQVLRYVGQLLAQTPQRHVRWRVVRRPEAAWSTDHATQHFTLARALSRDSCRRRV